MQEGSSERTEKSSLGDDLLSLLEIDTLVKRLETSCACVDKGRKDNRSERGSRMEATDDGRSGVFVSPEKFAAILYKKKNSAEAIAFAEKRHAEALRNFKKCSDAATKVANFRAKKFQMDSPTDPRAIEAKKNFFLNNQAEVTSVESARTELQEIADELEKVQKENAYWEQQAEKAMGGPSPLKRPAAKIEPQPLVARSTSSERIPLWDKNNPPHDHDNKQTPPSGNDNSENPAISRLSPRPAAPDTRHHSTSTPNPLVPRAASATAFAAAAPGSSLARPCSAPIGKLSHPHISSSQRTPRRGVVPIMPTLLDRTLVT